MNTYIKFNLLKFSLFQASAPPIVFFALNAFIGFKINFVVMTCFSLFAALLFAIAGAAMSNFVFGSVMINDEIKNSSKALGRGSVRISHAKKSFYPDLFFILLKDKKNKNFARIPRPFWAEDPSMIRQILERIKSN